MFIILPLLSAFLLILSFPFHISGYIAYISLVPLFLILSLHYRGRIAAISGALFGFSLSLYLSIPLYNSLFLSGAQNRVTPFFIVFITIIIPHMIAYSLFGMVYFFSRKALSVSWVFIPASFWILIDYIKEILPLSMPWGFAGYTQVFTPFIQSADLTGIHGVTFIIIISNTLLTEIIIHSGISELLPGKYAFGILKDNSSDIAEKKCKMSIAYQAILLAVILLTDLTYGIIKKKIVISKISDAPAIRYLIVQGNSESLERWNESSSMTRYQTYARMTEKEINKADLVIWPETVLNSSDKINFEIMSGISALLNEKNSFITGGIRRDNLGNTFNSVFIMKKNGLEYIYDKRILFPYSERPFLGKTAGGFLNSPEKFKAGTAPGISRLGNITAGISICFESIYPSEIRRKTEAGSALHINIANDSWFGDSSVPYLQQYAVIARAVENRISIIRSANSGISFSVTPAGDIVSEIPLNTRNISIDKVPVARINSIYVSTGNLIIIASIVMLLFAIIKNEIKNSVN